MFSGGMNNRPQSPGLSAHELSLRTRAAYIERMGREAFDLVVIGGGITGAGVALDARSRGLSVALIEKRDYASGTSSRSTKLIHGGLRYLEQFEFGLVREALQERAILTRIAPHLSEPLPFVIPVYEAGTPSPLGRNRLKLGLGLRLYDLLAGRKKIARHRWLGRDELLKLARGLDGRGLKGGFVYYDCLTNDSRLVIEVIKAAAARGALAANYAAARGFTKSGGRIGGVEVEDLLTGRTFEARARAVVNATGVWSDEVTRLDDPAADKRLRPSKGVHILVPAEKLGPRAAVLIPSLGEQRFLFVVPWCGRTLVGTTDTDYAGGLDEPRAEAEEVARIVDSAARYFPEADLSTRDVIATFAGLRPLVGQAGQPTKDVSRKEEILETSTGLISVIGGKLTTYRSIAEKIVDRVVESLARRGEVAAGLKRKSATAEIVLAGRAVAPSDFDREAGSAARRSDLPLETVMHLIRSYGGNFEQVLEVARETDDLRSPLIEGLPHIAAEIVYAARSEMAATVEDFLSRRTRIALVARDHGHSCAVKVARLMGQELGWSSAQAQDALAGYVT
jgi:glycerol-3-phosphate dehydrogenase